MRRGRASEYRKPFAGLTSPEASNLNLACEIEW